MFVCVCKAIRNTELKELIDSGANSLEAIGASCGAGTDCGSCVNRLKQALDEKTHSASPISEIKPRQIKRQAG